MPLYLEAVGCLWSTQPSSSDSSGPWGLGEITAFHQAYQLPFFQSLSLKGQVFGRCLAPLLGYGFPRSFEMFERSPVLCALISRPAEDYGT